jgi:hypothetical protein
VWFWVLCGFCEFGFAKGVGVLFQEDEIMIVIGLEGTLLFRLRSKFSGTRFAVLILLFRTLFCLAGLFWVIGNLFGGRFFGFCLRVVPYLVFDTFVVEDKIMIGVILLHYINLIAYESG